jgi:hypothetical protein
VSFGIEPHRIKISIAFYSILSKKRYVTGTASISPG